MDNLNFLLSEEALIKESYEAGKYAGSKNLSCFLVWKDLINVFHLDNNRKYHHIRAKTRKAFADGYKFSTNNG
jgi:hypothetical protein